MKTGRVLGIAVILSSMIVADAEARHGGGGKWRGGGGKWHGGGFRVVKFKGGGFHARPVAFRGARFVRPVAFSSHAWRGRAYRPYAFRRAVAYRPHAWRRVYRPYAFRRPVAYRQYAWRRGVYRPYAFRRSVAYRRALAANRWAWNRKQWRDWQERREDWWKDRKDWWKHHRPAYYSNYYYGGWPYYYSGYYAPTTYATTYVAPRYTFAVAGSSTVVAVQRRLARAGYYRGPIDGIMGPMTRSAIVRFERDRGIPPSASINRPLLISLGLA